MDKSIYVIVRKFNTKQHKLDGALTVTTICDTLVGEHVFRHQNPQTVEIQNALFDLIKQRNFDALSAYCSSTAMQDCLVPCIHNACCNVYSAIKFANNNEWLRMFCGTMTVWHNVVALPFLQVVVIRASDHKTTPPVPTKFEQIFGYGAFECDSFEDRRLRYDARRQVGLTAVDVQSMPAEELYNRVITPSVVDTLRNLGKITCKAEVPAKVKLATQLLFNMMRTCPTHDTDRNAFPRNSPAYSIGKSLLIDTTKHDGTDIEDMKNTIALVRQLACVGPTIEWIRDVDNVLCRCWDGIGSMHN